MSVVLDASAFLSLVFEDARASDTTAMKIAIDTFGAYVPPIWLTEIENVLVVGERAGRIDASTAAAILDVARKENITVDPVGPEVRFGSAVALARTYQLNAYDATYLALAQRKNLPLMTLDRKLLKAAQQLRLAWDKGYSPLVARSRRQR